MRNTWPPEIFLGRPFSLFGLFASQDCEDRMLAQLQERNIARSVPPRFSLRICSARLPTFLAMLQMVGYAPNVIRSEKTSSKLTEIVIEMHGCEHVADILLAWLRTIPGVEAAAII